MLAAADREFIVELSNELRDAILPHLGRPHARRFETRAVGGDATFSIDEVAEDILQMQLENYGDVAYYSEDKGLVSFGKPRLLLVVDPIDGSRPAAAGLESCCVSIAATERMDNPHLGDVSYAVVQEIKDGRLFEARRGRGLTIRGEQGEEEPHLPENLSIEALFWTIGFRGRPAAPLVEVLGDLMDASSLAGSVFDLGSASFAMTRLVTGQLDAYLDVGDRMLREVPELLHEFLTVGGGAVLNNSPYDVAAAKLVLEEAGCKVTDAGGNPLDFRPLLGSTAEFQVSCVATANTELHHEILRYVDQGMAELAARYAEAR